MADGNEGILTTHTNMQRWESSAGSVRLQQACSDGILVSLDSVSISLHVQAYNDRTLGFALYTRSINLGGQEKRAPDRSCTSHTLKDGPAEQQWLVESSSKPSMTSGSLGATTSSSPTLTTSMFLASCWCAVEDLEAFRSPGKYKDGVTTTPFKVCIAMKLQPNNSNGLPASHLTYV